ncbi:MAG: outer membrane beta-barrel protein [Xanthobacteraceae bacterium]|nr:outer membrane beta-barrel protein [Xanthobacteraceae bacterium]
MIVGPIATPAAGVLIRSAQSLSLELQWFGTVRGRVGWTCGERGDWLFYGTGGLAYGRVAGTAAFDRLTVPATPLSWGSETRFGWTAGAGLERAFGPWAVGLEYLYYDLGRTSIATEDHPNNLFGRFGSVFTVDPWIHGHIVRAKLSYRLGAPRPAP